jgi:hypothetical protein
VLGDGAALAGVAGVEDAEDEELLVEEEGESTDYGRPGCSFRRQACRLVMKYRL